MHQDPFNIVANVTRSGKDVSIEPVTIAIGDSRFDINARFQNFPDPNAASLTLNIAGPDFGRFNALFGLPGKLTGPFKVDATIKPLSPSGAAVDLAAQAQDIRLTVNGSVTDAEDFVGTRLRLQVAGPDLRTVTAAGGLAAAPAEAFDLALQLDRVREGLRLSDGSISVGKDHATFSGVVGDKPLEAATDVSFALAGLGIVVEALSPGKLVSSGAIRSRGNYFSLDNMSTNFAGAKIDLAGRVGSFPTLNGTDLEKTSCSRLR